MTTTKGRVAVIGAGVSGIGAANVWQRSGYDVVVYEAAASPGGQWLQAYPGVRLQNTYEQYHFPSFPWPFQPDRHPTKEQVLKYITLAIQEFDIDVKYKHRVVNIQRREANDGSNWELTIQEEGSEKVQRESFCYIVIAIGQYPWGEKKLQPSFPNRDLYKGTVLTNINSTQEDFNNKKVAVVGFGKTGLDFATWASNMDASNTTHIFRTPRWSIPEHIFGICYSRPFFARFSTDLMPSWCHSSIATQFLHSQMKSLVDFFWTFLIASVFALQHTRNAKVTKLPREERLSANQRLRQVFPPKTQFVQDLRSAMALCPDDYMSNVASGRLQVKRAEVEAFVPHGLKLSTGEEVEADVICLCCGNEAPFYSTFFDPASREAAILRDSEQQQGGLALYRHILHPSIPNLGFAGNNHSFLHTSLVEVGALWMVAAFEGYLELPSEKQQMASAYRVAQYKQQHIAFEPTYNMAVSTRFQQYLDMLCLDLGISPWRKLPNPVAEYFQRYGASDYATCVEEYLKVRETNKGVQHRVVFGADV